MQCSVFYVISTVLFLVSASRLPLKGQPVNFSEGVELEILRKKIKAHPTWKEENNDLSLLPPQAKILCCLLIISLFINPAPGCNRYLTYSISAIKYTKSIIMVADHCTAQWSHKFV